MTMTRRERKRRHYKIAKYAAKGIVLTISVTAMWIWLLFPAQVILVGSLGTLASLLGVFHHGVAHVVELTFNLVSKHDWF